MWTEGVLGGRWGAVVWSDLCQCQSGQEYFGDGSRGFERLEDVWRTIYCSGKG